MSLITGKNIFFLVLVACVDNYVLISSNMHVLVFSIVVRKTKGDAGAAIR
jgi:capsule polysaccharide export protein KpsE/RkpR